MNSIAASAVALACVGLSLLPRRWAFLPLLLGVCYVPFYLGLQLGALNFTAVRLLVAVGVLRLVLRGEWPPRPSPYLDRAIALFAAWLVLSGLFHEQPLNATVFRLGLAYDALGVYFIARCLCASMEDVIRMAQLIALALVPLAIAMLYEKFTASNPFAVLGGVGEYSMTRIGRVRANGPFGHPILAGTTGAVFLPMMMGLWALNRKLAAAGVIACVAIVFASASSGPILSMLAGLAAVVIWRFRAHIRLLLVLAVLVYILLDLVMKDPAYFLIARVDLAGGSTSWYRARLIQSAFEHLPEWWLTGTDRTSHWMWVVMKWSKAHTDITSHYIQLGVWGGLPLIFLFGLVLYRGFVSISPALRWRALSRQHAFLIWTVGCSLFAIAVTGFSVSYFDQSSAFLYVTLGILGSIASFVPRSSRRARQSTTTPVERMA